jgi:hypothetical protein
MKSMKHLATLLTPVFCAGLTAHGAFSVGDNLSVYFTGEAATRYESNVMLVDSSREEKGDTVVIFTPGIILNAGKPGVTDFSGQAMYRYKVYSYCDLSELDTENNDFSSSFTYKDASFKLTGAASYQQAQTNTDLSGEDTADLLQPGRVKRSVYSANSYAEMSVSPKTKFGMGIAYSLQDYSFANYTDFSSISLPFDFYYAITPKTDISVGYQYRLVYVGSSDSQDALDQTINIGLRGEILPKLTGFIRIGATNRDSEDSLGGKNETGISFAGQLSYAMSPLMTIGARITRDYSISPSSGHTTLRTGVGAVGTYKITRTVSFGGNLSYYITDYTMDGRDDNYLATGVFASYQPNEYFNFKLGYDYNLNDSNRQAGDYSNNILQAVATFRY